MINLRQLIVSALNETSQAAWSKAQKDSDQFGSGFEASPEKFGLGSLTPAQIAARKSAGVPMDALSQPGGRWYDKSGKYIGRTVDGKFKKADEKEQEKAYQRGGDTGDSHYRSQQRRDYDAKIKKDAEARMTPKQKMERAVATSTTRLLSKMGINNKSGGMTTPMAKLLAGERDNKKFWDNPNPNPTTEQDKQVFAVPLDDYLKLFPKTNEKEISAVGKANSKMPHLAPLAGVPLGVETDGGGVKRVVLRSKNINMYALGDEQEKKKAQNTPKA